MRDSLTVELRPHKAYGAGSNPAPATRTVRHEVLGGASHRHRTVRHGRSVAWRYKPVANRLRPGDPGATVRSRDLPLWKVCTNGRAPGLENRDVGREAGGGSNPLSSAQWRQQRVLRPACKAGAFGMVGSSPTASTNFTSPSSSADRTLGSEPRGAWFESTDGHCTAVQRVEAMEGSKSEYRRAQAGLE